MIPDDGGDTLRTGSSIDAERQHVVTQPHVASSMGAEPRALAGEVPWEAADFMVACWDPGWQNSQSRYRTLFIARQPAAPPVCSS